MRRDAYRNYDSYNQDSSQLFRWLLCGGGSGGGREGEGVGGIRHDRHQEHIITGTVILKIRDSI